ncbi:hypothetical protein Trco_001864 [Trichoderma cornu-damae]|uniref:Hydrophobin n=1 Tax=Trichoderma cornu-damae TaxID=654480 RepID=A0A9P8QTL0_9HYPO|nr:hypothetical protein Trco_001864 [Trichoderma cornu-damae]
MKFFAVASLFVAGVLASPVLDTRTNNVSLCPKGLYSVPQCCATDVLGVADLDCASPVGTLRDYACFKDACSSIGQRARCCVLPVLGQGVLCTAPLTN